MLTSHADAPARQATQQHLRMRFAPSHAQPTRLSLDAFLAVCLVLVLLVCLMSLRVHHSPLRGAYLFESFKSLYDVCRHCVRQAALLFHCHTFGFSLVTGLGLVMCWVSCCSSVLRPGAQVLWTLLCTGIALLTLFIKSIVRIRWSCAPTSDNVASWWWCFIMSKHTFLCGCKRAAELKVKYAGNVQRASSSMIVRQMMALCCVNSKADVAVQSSAHVHSE